MKLGTVLYFGEDKEFVSHYKSFLKEINKELDKSDPYFFAHPIREREALAAMYAATVPSEDSMANFYLESMMPDDDCEYGIL